MSKHFTDENFQKEVIEESKSKPVLVDFFAEWCGPCKIQGPIIEEVSEVIGEKAVVGKVDVEEAKAIAAQYNIMSIPTLILFKDGEAKETLNGLNAKENLIEILNKYSS